MEEFACGIAKKIRLKGCLSVCLWVTRDIYCTTRKKGEFLKINRIYKKTAWKYYTLTMTMTGGREKGE